MGSQQDLFNAIKSGYGYVQLKEDLTGPIIMTGNSLDLSNDLVIDLNGNEIERNNRKSLLNVSEGKTFTVIDSRGGGGMYNPIGSVLTVDGGELNVYGGMFESGPRPSEYFSILKNSYSGNNLIDVGATYDMASDGSISGSAISRPRLAVRPTGLGNVYFDTAYVETGSALNIDRDTYCYVVVKGETSDDFATFDTSAATFAYTYYIDAEGRPTDDGLARGARQVMMFGYDDDIEMSVEKTDASGNVITPAPNYAAVSMLSGTLNVDVTEASVSDLRARTAGSFHQYFGTWQTSCIYIEGGVMNVSTSGIVSTVNPNELPLLQTGETRYNSAKYGESACILSVSKTDAAGKPKNSGGKLNIKKLDSATSYNGSVISLSGGSVVMYDANITKNATISHGDDPFAVAEDADSGTANTGSEFPADRQYRDAAVFLNGGSLTLYGTDDREKAKSVNVTVNKDINNEKARAAGQTAQTYPIGEIGYGTGSGSLPYKSTFGILSRGKSNLTASSFEANNLAVNMHGPYSYGIFGTRGEVKITDGSVTLDSDSHSYGIYAVNRTSVVNPDGSKRAVNVELVNTDITLGNLTGSPTYEGNGDLPDEDTWMSPSGTLLGTSYADGAMRAASCGVYLDSSKFSGGAVTLDRSKVRSRELGVAVYDGTLTFKNGGGIDAYNASAVCLDGGNIVFENNAAEGQPPSNYDINCYINRKGTGASGCSASTTEADAAGSHQYEIYLPYQRTLKNDDGTRVTYTNENGIRVVGGSLTAHGKLTMNFRGLYNDYSQYVTRYSHDSYSDSNPYNNYDRVKIKSFAVACINEETGKDTLAAANITIEHADITASVGGGVKVQGGSITLGINGVAPENNDISVHTTGVTHLDSTRYAWYGERSLTWQFFPNLSGGHAIISRGGSIDIYGGTYIADNCNGVAASNDGEQATVINIYGGTFTGNMSAHGSGTHDYDQNFPSWGDKDISRVQIAGPSTFYGLKVLGESSINIHGGTFDGKNGGAFVRGKSKTQRTQVKIYAGAFNSEGNDGINVGDYSTVYFGAYTNSELNALGKTTFALRQRMIRASATLFPISVNTLLPKTSITLSDGAVFDGYDSDVRVYVYYGSYKIGNPAYATNALGYIMNDLVGVDFFVFGYGTNVEAQQGANWPNTRIKYEGVNGGGNLNNDDIHDVRRRVAASRSYYNGNAPVAPSAEIIKQSIPNETGAVPSGG